PPHSASIPGMALRIAASITVAPFSTSMVRDSPEWSTKVILAMIARNSGKKGSGQSYNGSIRPALVRGIWAKPAILQKSGATQHRVDGGPRLGDGMLQPGQRLGGIVAIADRGLNDFGGVGDTERTDRARRTFQRVRERRRIRG